MNTDTKVLKLVRKSESTPMTTTELPDHKLLIEMYRTMYLSRRLDDKEIQLKGQNRIFFQISGAGHEAVLVAAGVVLKPGYDWFYPYYRDRALCLQLGMTPLEQLLSAVGAEADPNSHGRQMPSHWGHKKLNIVSQSSPTGTQLLQAVGCAEASYRFELIPELQKRISNFRHDEVTYVSLGDGTTSEGEFWEALNTASNLKLPVLFLVEDNGYAISVPMALQSAVKDIAVRGAGYNMPGIVVDGDDVLQCYRVGREAIDRARAGEGPTLIEAKVTRLTAHSSDDQQTKYRSAEELEAERGRDPLPRFLDELRSAGFLDDAAEAEIVAEARKVVEDATEWAETQPDPDPATAQLHVYADEPPARMDDSRKISFACRSRSL